MKENTQGETSVFILDDSSVIDSLFTVYSNFGSFDVRIQAVTELDLIDANKLATDLQTAIEGLIDAYNKKNSGD